MGLQGVDIVLLLILVIALIKGLLDGFVRQVFSLIGLVAAVFIAFWFLPSGKEIVIGLLPETNPMLVAIIAWIAIFIIVRIIFYLLQRILQRIVDIRPISWINKLAGGAVAVLASAFLLSVLLVAYDKGVKQYDFPPLKDKDKPAVVYDKVLDFSPMVIEKYWKKNVHINPSNQQII